MNEAKKVEQMALAQVREDSVLGEFALPIANILAPDSPPDEAFARLGERIGASAKCVTLAFRVSNGSEVRSWSLESGPEQCSVAEGEIRAPDIEILVDHDTWGLVAKGSISPLEAFGRGKMRVRGDIRLLRRIVRRLHRSDERASANGG